MNEALDVEAPLDNEALDVEAPLDNEALEEAPLDE